MKTRLRQIKIEQELKQLRILLGCCAEANEEEVLNECTCVLQRVIFTFEEMQEWWFELERV